MWFCEYTEWTVNFGVTQFCAFAGFENAKNYLTQTLSIWDSSLASGLV